MPNNTLHLLTRRKSAVGIPALTCMNQAVDTPLNGLFASNSRVRLVRVARRRTGPIIKVETKFVHFVRMAGLLEAANTEIEIVAYSAMISTTKNYEHD